jgi:malonate transporter and related proteins
VNSPVIDALSPVVLLIAAGFAAGYFRWIEASAVRSLSNLVFFLLAPALLFRSMSSVQITTLDFRPIALYFLAVALLFGAVLWRFGLTRSGAVLALAGTFSNTFMIGVPLIGLAYGQPGLVLLFTLIAVHSLVLLTCATLVLELAVARENAATGPTQAQAHTQTPRHNIVRTLLSALRSTILHPVPLPIALGLAFGLTGWTIPVLLDKPLALLGSAFSPLALVLVGVTLATTPVGTHVRSALGLSLVKNIAHPLLLAALGLAFGLRGVPLAVMVVTASLPIGANVFLFAQRYNTAPQLITASVAVSTALACVTVSAAMWGAERFLR